MEYLSADFQAVLDGRLSVPSSAGTSADSSDGQLPAWGSHEYSGCVQQLLLDGCHAAKSLVAVFLVSCYCLSQPHQAVE
jgi:hypothetical protein